jgi:anti-sigma regulatory factor (Ser/Thr protein kinase)
MRASFPPDPSSARRARAFIREAITHLQPDAHISLDAVALLTSELVGNAVLHTDSSAVSVLVEIPDPDHVRVSVSDESVVPPVLRSPGPGDISGRGLHIVEYFADAWGARGEGSAGKAMWFEVSDRSD